ncbi:tRNA wybutosine-synthesizing protein 4-like [Dermatophagoides pteronyssinus]|uniref:tRNA wybutosine-synthesizing protein 4-like n=1 Tax=Dermatophagoides pteronyssinus TaxID=6956 RepID=UPI003F67C272
MTKKHSKIDNKKSITGTNDFSTLSKYSMINKGYCFDPYLKYFINSNDDDDSKFKNQRAPIIHHGYYVRFKALEYGWQNVLSSGDEQINIIISFGAGFDTTAFRYQDDRNIFIEIDHPDVCRRKADIIRLNIDEFPDMKTMENCSSIEHLYLQSSRYLLFGIDLRQSPTQVINILFVNENHLLNKMIDKVAQNRRLNFILFNECSLCYIEQQFTDQLIAKMIDFITEQYSNYDDYSIQYLGYEMYDSFGSENDFKKFMLNHFEQLNAPIQTFINENQIWERFHKLNFEQINLINMKKFYRELLSNDERKRINQIELFDEWEELENVCQVYCLVICKKFKPSSSTVTTNESNDSMMIITNRPEKDDRFSANAFPLLQIFGHCSHYDDHNNTINIFGGFGIESNQKSGKNNRGKHCRFKSIVQLSLDDSKQHINNIQMIESNESSNINRLHCRIVSLGDGKHYLLSGGRRSPNLSLGNSILAIDNDLKQFEYIETFDNIIHTNRHVCARFGHQNQQICLFGGRCNDQSSNDKSTIWIFDSKSSKWFQTKINGLEIDNRHSMAYTTFQNHSILLNGGIDCDDNNFLPSSNENYIELIDSRQANVEKFLIKNLDEKFYSHQMKIMANDDDDHRILMIGGIGNRKISNQINQIDFRSMKIYSTKRIDIIDDNHLLMLHNFSCELIKTNNSNNNYLWTIGGGGNYFHSVHILIQFYQ